MRENEAIDQPRLKPLLPTQGEHRQTVSDWRAAGVEWPTIETTVYHRASNYRPSDRYSQITRMTYFDAAVRDAHEKRLAMDVQAPAVPTEEQIVRGFGSLAGGPVVQEWAERTDAKLREAMGDSAVALEIEQVRANLRRLNENERDFRYMKAPEQEAYLWIRVLNWYGEKIGDPRPSHLRAA